MSTPLSPPCGCVPTARVPPSPLLTPFFPPSPPPSRPPSLPSPPHSRRLLGDRQWAFDTPFADVAAYFPCPVVALRTLKAEVAVGIPAAAAAAAAAADPTWLVSGAFGVVHYCHPAEVLASRAAGAAAAADDAAAAPTA